MNEKNCTEIKGLLTTAQVAKRFAVTPLSVTLWRTKRGLPFVRIVGAGRDTIRFKAKAVEEWARKGHTKVRALRKRRKLCRL